MRPVRKVAFALPALTELIDTKEDLREYLKEKLLALVSIKRDSTA